MNTASGHRFEPEISKPGESIKSLHGPIYAEGNGHQFNIVPDKPPSVKDMNCPVYLTNDARHKYSEFIKKVEGRSLLQTFLFSLFFTLTDKKAATNVFYLI